tara:strand:- start:231 stop:383 length:153 start_codon:yes stop_codon:yes gene_type:complete
MRFGAVEVVMIGIGVLCLVTVATARDYEGEMAAVMREAAHRFELRMPYRK